MHSGGYSQKLWKASLSKLWVNLELFSVLCPVSSSAVANKILTDTSINQSWQGNKGKYKQKKETLFLENSSTIALQMVCHFPTIWIGVPLKTN